MYVCLCNGITDRQVRLLTAEGDRTVSEIYRTLGGQPRCGRCVPTMRGLIRESAASGGEAAGS